MLRDAGVAHECVAPDVDESALKARLLEADELPVRIAEEKALSVSRVRTNDWVVGSDSAVRVADRLFSKPRSYEEAAEHLRFFSGKTMVLTSGVALAQGGRINWSEQDSATLHVRPLSDQFIQSYLDAEWPQVGFCVGVFRMEGLGVQLFERVEGSHFTILGMPLMPLLAALRSQGLLLS